MSAAPPETQFDSTPPNPSNSSTADFTFSSNLAGGTFTCKLDAQVVFTSCTSPRTISGLTDGQHTLEVKAAVGPEEDASPASYTWTVDTQAPITALGSVKIKRSSRKATFNLSSNEPGTTFLCKIDKKAFAPCTSPKKYKKLKVGKHKFQALAIDALGNRDPSSVVKKFRI